MTRPRNDRFRVGQCAHGGQVTVWLELGDSAGPPRVGLNAAYLMGVSIDISLRDAAALRDNLGLLLVRVGWVDGQQI